MTKKQIITEHNKLVALRKEYVKAEGCDVFTLDREISRLGQIHNPLISVKARKAITLKV